MERHAVPAIGKMPVELMREIEMQKISATLESTKVQMLMVGQAQLAAAWLSTPGDSKSLRIRQAVSNDGKEPVVFETLIELL